MPSFSGDGRLPPSYQKDFDIGFVFDGEGVAEGSGGGEHFGDGAGHFERLRPSWGAVSSRPPVGGRPHVWGDVAEGAGTEVPPAAPDEGMVDLTVLPLALFDGMVFGATRP